MRCGLCVRDTSLNLESLAPSLSAQNFPVVLPSRKIPVCVPWWCNDWDRCNPEEYRQSDPLDRCHELTFDLQIVRLFACTSINDMLSSQTASLLWTLLFPLLHGTAYSGALRTGSTVSYITAWTCICFTKSYRASWPIHHHRLRGPPCCWWGLALICQNL